MARTWEQDLEVYEQDILLYHQERIAYYRPGGYHPVTLGDRFNNGRYEIHHKLGYGGFATVWLARDSDLDTWVALKVMIADGLNPCKELSVLKDLQARFHDSLRSRYVVQLLDDFVHEGPNGSHQCIVLELLGPSLASVLDEYAESAGTDSEDSVDRLSSDDTLHLSRQLLESLAAIHEAGFCHGDLSSSNIAFTCKNAVGPGNDQIFSILDKPCIKPLKLLDGSPLEVGLPTKIVRKADWDWTDEHLEDLRLIDFGEAFNYGSPPTELAQPPDLQAPETIFSQPSSFDYKIDLWRAGIILFSMIFPYTPFTWTGRLGDLAMEMMMFTGEMPETWRARWESLDKRQPKSWEELRVEVQEWQYSLDQMFRDAKLEPELDVLLPVMKGLFKLRPEERLTAGEALAMLEEGGINHSMARQERWYG